MTTIIVLFNLKPGIDAAAYEGWAIANDLPAVRGLGSVGGFDVLRTAGLLGSDAAPPYQYVEIIHVDDMKQFGADTSTDAMTAIAQAFQRYADHPVFMLTRPVQ